MPFYPTVRQTATTRRVTDTFLGYDHRPKIKDGEWYDMTNLTASRYPLMSSRDPRGTAAQLSNPLGLCAKDALAWVDGGTLYYNGIATGLNNLSVPIISRSNEAPAIPADGEYWYNSTAGETKIYRGGVWQSCPYPAKQLVGMGAYLCVFPDKVYINTADLTDYGSMEARFTAAGVTAQVSTATGEAIDLSGAAVQNAQPEDPANGDWWIDTSAGTHSLNQYSAASGTWVQVPTVYTALRAEGIGANFAQYDGVTLSGCEYTDGGEVLAAQAEALNGSQIIYDRGDDYIVIAGLLDRGITLSSVTVERTVPQMDYVCQCGNRLWGCYYGMKDGAAVNELYCCALGDFKNWQRYMGISTDSWAAGVGSDGPWTGAVNYLGSPVFFKEDHIHTVSISAAGAHQVDELAARGVQKGSHRSLAVAGETLYYLSRSGVCAYQGGLPVDVSADFGGLSYREGSAGAIGGKYYISMRSDDGWNLFALDSALGLWHREDGLHAISFAAADNDLMCLDARSGAVLSLLGSHGSPEGAVQWEAVSGIMYYDDPDHKYVSRYNLRLGMGEGASMNVYIRYDSQGDWEDGGSVILSGTGTVTLPIRPRRCDHLQIKLAGNGPVMLYSIARIYESGSDVG